MLEFDVTLDRSGFSLQAVQQLPLQGIWGIMGRSGCGKTTLLRILAGLEKKAKGQVRWRDQLWQCSEQRIWVEPEKRGIGYIFQDGRLFPHLTVQGNLDFAIKRRVSAQGPDLDDIVQWLGIEHLLHRSVSYLSGGERQRVAVARALSGNPRLLLMDEPMASLDWSSKISILPVLRQVYEHFGVPVVVVSHDREEVARLATDLLLMNNGQVVDKGSCKSLLSTPGHALASDDQALAVLEAEVKQHNPCEGVTELWVEGQKLVVDSMTEEAGSSVRIVVPAHDVSLMKGHSVQTSIQNQLDTVITAASEVGDHHLLLQLQLGRQNLMALITRRAWNRLELALGQNVVACFKAAGLSAF
ncbi:molybdenum ABC transporter ATP-binding protein [Spongorhabdus nitratireducens]